MDYVNSVRQTLEHATTELTLAHPVRTSSEYFFILSSDANALILPCIRERASAEYR